jgi:hypothetical protein
MHELLVTFADHSIKKHIAIEPDPNISAPTEKHVIKIKQEVDDDIINKIKPIVEKHKLKIEKIKDAVVIL